MEGGDKALYFVRPLGVDMPGFFAYFLQGQLLKDHLHKLTTTIAKSHGLVCVEDLRVANMSRSAKGTVDQPGCNVCAKSSLNRRILD